MTVQAQGRRPDAEPKNPRVYFQRGTVILLVEHASGLRPEEVTDDLKQHLLFLKDVGDNLLGGLLRRMDVQGIDPARTLTFPHLNPDRLRRAAGQMQIALSQRTPERTPRNQAFSLVFASLYKRNQAADPEHYISNKLLIRLLQSTNKKLARRKRNWAMPIGEQLTLRAVSPNWLNTPAPDVAGGGGPGARPVPVDQTKIDEILAAWNALGGAMPTAFDALPFGFKFDFPLLAGAGCDGPQRPVKVVILDTAPSEDQRNQAAQWTNPGSLTQPLLKSLLESGVLSFTYAGDWNIPLPPVGDILLRKHDYSMNDHGLFVAGIIHSIVPTVPIQLIQVLNENGVGYAEGIAKAINTLIASQPTDGTAPALLINCSLTLAMPLPGHLSTDPSTDDELADAISVVDEDGEAALELVTVFKSGQALTGFSEAEIMADPRAQEIMTQINVLGTALEWVMDAMRNQDAMVVAAAGNDGRVALGGVGSGHRPQARLPAAFATVVGVGALDKTGANAAYSNRADRQPKQGLATFGGKDELIDSALGAAAAPGTDEMAPGVAPFAIQGESLLGVYIGQFPDLAPKPNMFPNANGWAYWAGSSFATPIVTGALARLLRNGCATSLDMAHQLLIASFAEPASGDDLLKVDQG
jgi:hypothetical protein